ncbi:GRF zinc finger containing protein [Striga asiatica]|uniref:GRF zinc finger containing protein n=1 Tax=Striga asiatica TaxID=4170 RepID=A0A5A7P5N4_STRAF|nr:GRF zinc finger containing protein [Striga asiatica]
MWRQTSEVTLDEYCTCGKRTVMVTSWTDNNPGRRYAKCNESGCKRFVWIDPPMCTRARQIIPGLLRRINLAEAELASKKKRVKWLWFAIVVSWIMMFFLLKK